MIKKMKHWIKNNKTIVGNIFSLWALQIFNYIIPLITLPYVLRVLWPEKFWIIAFATAFVGYFMIITNYGFNLTATKDISMNREDNKKVSEIFWNVIIIKCILAILSFFVFLWIVFSFTKFSSEVIVFIFTFLMIIWEILFPVWMFQWMEKMKYITIINVIVKSLFLLPVFVFIQNIWDYIRLPLITSLSFITTGIIAFFMALKVFRLQFILPNFQSIKYHLAEWWHVFISSISYWIYASSTTVILWLITNNTIVWYYAGAEKILKSLQSFISIIYQSVFPNIWQKLKNSKKETILFLQKLSLYQIIFNLFIAIFLFIFSELLILWLLWDNFEQSIVILKILSITLIFFWFSNIAWVITMLNFWYKKEFVLINFWQMLLFVIISPIVISYYKEIGLSLFIVLLDILISFIMWYILYKRGINLINLKNVN